MRIPAGLFAIAAIALMGCAVDAEEDEEVSGSTDQAVVGGTTTFEHPEIGKLRNGGSYCTATLIRPGVVLTAAHCVTGSPKDEAVTSYSFEIRTSATNMVRFAIDRAYSVPVAADFAGGAQDWREKDIALLRLTTDVPETLAKPLRAATAWPTWGARVAIYGYGCSSRVVGPDGHRPGGETKRKKEFDWSLGLVFGWSDTQNTCPGDSGGPSLDVATGTVYGTTSGYVSGNDRFGDVPANIGVVNGVADKWWPRR